jgi:hypothetical protein
MLPVLSEKSQRNPRGNVPSTSSNLWPYLGGWADAHFNRCYAACACGTKPRRGPSAVMLEEDVKQEKNKSADLRQSIVNVAEFTCLVVR